MNPRFQPYNDDLTLKCFLIILYSQFLHSSPNRWSGFWDYWLVLQSIENLMNGTTHYELLCVWLLLLTIRILRLIRVVECIIGSMLSILCVYYNLFILSTCWRTFGFFLWLLWIKLLRLYINLCVDIYFCNSSKYQGLIVLSIF